MVSHFEGEWCQCYVHTIRKMHVCAMVTPWICVYRRSVFNVGAICSLCTKCIQCHYYDYTMHIVYSVSAVHSAQSVSSVYCHAPIMHGLYLLSVLHLHHTQSACIVGVVCTMKKSVQCYCFLEYV